MHAVISNYHESDTCTWCSRDTEGVTVEFDGGFLHKGPLCCRRRASTIGRTTTQPATRKGRATARNQRSATTPLLCQRSRARRVNGSYKKAGGAGLIYELPQRYHEH